MILSCLVATFLACHVIIREQAAVLMSGASKGGHFGKSVKSQFPPLGLVIAFRNAVHNSSVSAATFSGVCGCVFLIVVALIARFSVSDMKDVQFGELQDYDYVAYVDKNASYSDRDAFDSYLYN